MRAIDKLGSIIIKATDKTQGLNAALQVATIIARTKVIYIKPNSRNFKKVYRGHRLKA